MGGECFFMDEYDESVFFGPNINCAGPQHYIFESACVRLSSPLSVRTVRFGSVRFLDKTGTGIQNVRF